MMFEKCITFVQGNALLKKNRLTADQCEPAKRLADTSAKEMTTDGFLNYIRARRVFAPVAQKVTRRKWWRWKVCVCVCVCDE
jgi:hypothetical protein